MKSKVKSKESENSCVEIRKIENKSGRVFLYGCQPYGQIRLWVNDVRIDELKVEAPAAKGMWINYCMEGSCEMEIENESYLYLGSGQICLGPNAARERFRYPGGRYLGFELFLPFNLDRALLRLIRSIGFSMDEGKNNQVGLPAPELRRYLQRVSEMLIDGTGAMEEYRIHTLQILHLSGKRENIQPDRRNFLSKGQRDMALAVAKAVADRPGEHLTVKRFADEYKVHPDSLKKYFNLALGMTFTEYRQKVSCDRAADLLLSTDASVGEIAEQVGYAHQGKFGAVFKREKGYTPLEYRRLMRTS